MMRRSIQSFHFLNFSVLMVFLVVIFACDTQEAVAKSKRGFLGVIVEEMTPSMRKAMKVGNQSGLLITQVIHRSPADDAGIREDDIITKYDGQSVDIVDDFVLLVRNTEPKSTVKIDVVRDGEEKQFEVTIEKKRRKKGIYSWHNDEHSAPNVFAFDRPQMGVKVHELTDDLAGYFDGAENGVLVLSVTEDSPAEAAGFKAGDIITKIDDETVDSPSELIELLSDYDGGDTISVEYVRKGSKSTVDVELEENSQFSENLFHRFAPNVVVPRVESHNGLRKHIEVIMDGKNGDLEI